MKIQIKPDKKPRGKYQVGFQQKKTKCFILKWPPCSNLQIAQSRFDQIINILIFSNSTRRGQLRNVHDGISRPLGNREIKKYKVGTVLPDTLHF